MRGNPRLAESFAPDLLAPSAARAALGALHGSIGADMVERCRLVVTELVTNSVRHAGLDGGQPIGVQVHTPGQLVRIEVLDRGPGFDPLPVEKPEAGRALGGWGLWLVDRLADRWGAERGHSMLVWAEFDR